VSFHLHNRLRDWFGYKNNRMFAKTYDPQLEEGGSRFILFDAFYCCLLVGLDSRRHGKKALLETADFYRGYPDLFKSQAELVAGLLVEAELARQDINENDKRSIEGEMVRLLDLSSVTRLSDDGNELLDLYAAAGFEILEDKLPQPDNLEDFLVAYHDYWGTDV